MKIFITGAEGFVGRHLFNALSCRNHEVYGGYFIKDGDDSFFKNHDKNLLFLDITKREETIDLVREIGPDAVVHLAAVSFVPDGKKDPYNIILTNIYGTQNIISSVESLQKPCSFLFASSGEIYGSLKTNQIIAETTPAGPKNLYAVTKLTGEYLALQSGINPVILRLFNHTGKGQRTDFVLPSFAKQIASIGRKGPGELRVGNLESFKDFLDIRDVVEAYVKAIEDPVPGIFNVCSGNTCRLYDIVMKMIKSAKAEIKITVDKTRFRKNDGGYFTASNSKFSSAFGWKPVYSIDDTIESLIKYYRYKEDI